VVSVLAGQGLGRGKAAQEEGRGDGPSEGGGLEGREEGASQGPVQERASMVGQGQNEGGRKGLGQKERKGLVG
jgi:hypothetical protein